MSEENTLFGLPAPVGTARKEAHVQTGEVDFDPHTGSLVSRINSGTEPLLVTARRDFHRDLASALTIDAEGVPSNADSSSRPSIRFAQGVAERLGTATRAKKLQGQTLGARFEQATANFLGNTFPYLDSLRPGDWTVRRIGDNSHPGFKSQKQKIEGSIYEQYEHLADLETIVKENRAMQASLGNAYAIAPDVVVTRMPVGDDLINRDRYIVGEDAARYAPIRSQVQTRALLHAVISCKWTIRTDRAQNARSEALNLIRNRKGRTPHIAIVTAEPVPNRLASLALGTGDVDCVYHFALPELMHTLEEDSDESAFEMLQMMVHGKRLKDISDLPLDLAV